GYVAAERPFDKAGGYAVQEGGGGFVEEIHGSYTNVVGLPLEEVVGALQRLGFDTGGRHR
ncbi:MAG: Maf family protein, partial [Vicinamibacteria bacterium]